MIYLYLAFQHLKLQTEKQTMILLNNSKKWDTEFLDPYFNHKI